MLGPIPEAPGLQDLDTIHPVEEMIQVEKDEGPMPLPLPRNCTSSNKPSSHRRKSATEEKIKQSETPTNRLSNVHWNGGCWLVCVVEWTDLTP